MRANASTLTLPPDIRLMNGATAVLVAVLLAALLVLAYTWVARLPVFSIRAIQVEGDASRNGAASLRANALPRMSGSFISMNLQQGRQAFEAVPWVRTAIVQRVWPNLLRVRLEEHKPAAYWETKVEGADADSDASIERSLVNSFGEVFQANLGDVEEEDLPVLAGPAGSAAHMLQMWQQLQKLIEPMADNIERIDLSGRGSWRLALNKGGQVELGRGSDAEVLARFGQFVHTITQITSRYQTQVLTADLRHADGYAVRLRGVSTTPVAPKSPPKKN